MWCVYVVIHVTHKAALMFSTVTFECCFSAMCDSAQKQHTKKKHLKGHHMITLHRVVGAHEPSLVYIHRFCIIGVHNGACEIKTAMSAWLELKMTQSLKKAQHAHKRHV